MNDRSVNSYDLNEARQILSALTPVTQTTQAVAVEVAATYVRLVSDAVPRTAAPTVVREVFASPDVQMEEADLKPQKFSGWESCVAWCMQLTRAEAAFVVDSQGFIIASRGRVPGHGFEGAGAELVCSVEQLERIEPDAGRLLWVDLDFDKRRIVGFITPSETKEYYVVGMISPDPGYHSLKQIVSRQIVENLPNLD
jgi:hypothetical protein